ncbi:hypothetical protein [Thermospira aquatica]|uniref:DUF5668 domain-containing protein n=1 Tax=Thermospira aquatica TaxID=2828656 RepID=A0AAX3BG93_9SPIR|nr:hypothetical protein [Thermospira aquatica]URA10441.1 hypothetical protein KDW03_01160 [Thermospira aquatica]
MQTKPPFSVIVTGILLIGIGLAFLLETFIPGLKAFSLWPLFLLIPVILMLSEVKSRKDLSSKIFGITYLLYLVVFFIVLNTLGWHHMSTLWPHFILAASVGLFAEFVVTLEVSKLWEMATAVVIAAYFLVPGLSFRVLAGVLLIFWGIWLLIKTFLPSKKKNN